jgi:hypothetical protein
MCDQSAMEHFAPTARGICVIKQQASRMNQLATGSYLASISAYA